MATKTSMKLSFFYHYLLDECHNALIYFICCDFTEICVILVCLHTIVTTTKPIFFSITGKSIVGWLS